jgi:MYXO-CTERM domain-containing protein
VNGNRPHISVAHAQAGAGCLEAAEKKRGHGSPDNFAAVTAAALTAAAVIRRRREAIGIAWNIDITPRGGTKTRVNSPTITVAVFFSNEERPSRNKNKGKHLWGKLY